MKKNILLLVALATALASCEVQSSDNGDLDGFWHLLSVDTLSTSGTLDMGDQRAFWSVQKHLLSVRGITDEYLFHFEHKGDSLLLRDAYLSDRSKGDVKVEDPAQLAPYGINSLEEHFAVESLDKSRMILRSSTLRLRLKKY